MEFRWMQGFSPNIDPWRRGIYRINAQRLSSIDISLDPPVAHRNLLFRIKGDLASSGKWVDSYSGVSIFCVSRLKFMCHQLEESPSITTHSASARSSTNLNGLSVIVPHYDLPSETPLSVGSALSPASVYSQESWNPNSSLLPPTVDLGPGQHTMAFSPTAQPNNFSPALVRMTPSLTPSSARLKMIISTSKAEEVGVADRVLIGTIQLVDEPKLVVAIRLRIKNTEESLVSPDDIESEEHERD